MATDDGTVVKTEGGLTYYPTPEESLPEEILRAKPWAAALHHYTGPGQTTAFTGRGNHLPPPPGPYVVPELKASCDWMMPTQDTQVDGAGGRPSWADTFVQVAFTVAQRGTCPARRVGCVVTSADNHILATGYNGAPAGLPHCTQVGCSRAVHAEMNAVLQAAYIGVSIKGAVLYCTARPCLNCAKAIIQVGVSRVVWAIDDTESRSRTEILGLLSRAGVDFSQYVPREED
jgi:dCMP deaminase